MPGAQAALTVRCAWIPLPDESSKVRVTAEQSSNIQNAEGCPGEPPAPALPAIPPPPPVPAGNPPKPPPSGAPPRPPEPPAKHPLRSKVQPGEQARKPSGRAPMVTLAHVSPLKSLPSHCSEPSTIPLPHTPGPPEPALPPTPASEAPASSVSCGSGACTACDA